MFLRFFFRVLDLFYRRTQIGHPVPKTGPLILVANHPNGLVDPVVLARVAARPVKMLAKEPIFRMPLIGWMARKSGAIPVYRAQDGHDTSANAGVFDAVHAELANGGAVLLFPEGISHNQPNLQKLKTGAARMALGAEALAGIPMGTKIIPVGIVYRNKAKFGSSIAVEVGEAIEVEPFNEAWKQNQREAAQALTNEIAAGLSKVMLELERWDDLPLLQFAGDVLGENSSSEKQDRHRIQRLRDLANFGKEQAESNPAELKRLRRRLKEFSNRLDRLGFKVRDLDADYNFSKVVVFVAVNLVAILIGLPIAIIGAVFWFTPWAVSTLVLKLIDPDHDIVATIKVLAACLFFPLWLAAVFFMTPYSIKTILASLVLLSFCGIYARHFLRRRGTAIREAKVFLQLPARQRLRQLLRKERDEIRRLLQG